MRFGIVGAGAIGCAADRSDNVWIEPRTQLISIQRKNIAPLVRVLPR